MSGSVTKMTSTTVIESNANDDVIIVDKNVFSNLKNRSMIDKSECTVANDDEFRLAVEKAMMGMTDLPKNWNFMTVREQRDWVDVQIKFHRPDTPDSLRFLAVASTVNGECENSTVPEWLDRKKFERGQRFAMKYFAGTAMAEMLSLYALFSFDYGLKPLIVTEKSSEPFTAFKRYLSTVKRIRNWYSTDVWTKGTNGNKDINAVRRMHGNIRKRLNVMSHVDIDKAAEIPSTWSSSRTLIRDDFRDSCQAPKSTQCLYVFSDDESYKRPKSLNQSELAATQFGFMGLIVLYPNFFGIHGTTDDDLDDYCHLWRGLGYLLGIDDEFNFCKGTIDEVRQRSRDFLEYWVKPNFREITPEWEHMMRCVMEGIAYYFPKVSYEPCLLYLADMIDVRMPRLEASISYAKWLHLVGMKIAFKWTSRIPGVMTVMNYRLMTSINNALRYTDEELDALRLRSKNTLSKATTEISDPKQDWSTATPTSWQRAPFFVFLSILFLLNLPILVKDYAKQFFRSDDGTSQQS